MNLQFQPFQHEYEPHSFNMHLPNTSSDSASDMSVPSTESDNSQAEEAPMSKQERRRANSRVYSREYRANAKEEAEKKIARVAELENEAIALQQQIYLLHNENAALVQKQLQLRLFLEEAAKRIQDPHDEPEHSTPIK
ncbi:MAG: hypothetical protein JSR46_03975 [Verrucomicrobia bacterium]|nr:hypothetical protein [Verrucomicrobiota bacterium]